MALDTLAMQLRLRAAGLNDLLSGAVTKEIDYAITTVAVTKEDLQEVRNELKAAITQLRGEVQEIRNELKAEITQIRGEVQAVRNELYAVRNELKAEIAQLRGEVQEVRNEILAVRNELKADINRLESRITELANEIAGFKNSLADYKVSSSRWMLGITVTIALGFAAIVVALALG